MFGELFAEVLIGLIPYLAIDFRKWDVGAFNELFGFADAQVVDVGIHRHAELFRKEPVEVIESDARRLGDFAAADLAVEIGRNEIGGGAQVLDPAAHCIIRLRVILSDFGEKCGNEKIEVSSFVPGRLLKAVLKFMHDGDHVSRIGESDDALRLREELADRLIAGDEVPERVLERRSGVGYEFYFDGNDLRDPGACADGVQDIDVDEHIVVGIEGHFLPLVVFHIQQGDFSVVDIEKFQPVMAVRIVKFIVLPDIDGVICDAKPGIPVIFIKKGECHLSEFLLILLHYNIDFVCRQ